MESALLRSRNMTHYHTYNLQSPTPALSTTLHSVTDSQADESRPYCVRQHDRLKHVADEFGISRVCVRDFLFGHFRDNLAPKFRWLILFGKKQLATRMTWSRRCFGAFFRRLIRTIFMRIYRTWMAEEKPIGFQRLLTVFRQCTVRDGLEKLILQRVSCNPGALSSSAVRISVSMMKHCSFSARVHTFISTLIHYKLTFSILYFDNIHHRLKAMAQ